jgi:hypothetical protein
MKSLLLAMTAAVVAFGGAKAAELPSLKHARDGAPKKSCTIDGMKGFLIPGAETCVKISGYVEVGAAVRR